MKPSVRKNINVGGRIRDIKKILKKNRHRLDGDTINNYIERLHLYKIEPLFTREDASSALTNFEGYPLEYPVSIGNNLTCTFYDAGHILGSAISMVKYNGNGRSRTICFTGDIGRFNKPIIEDPTLNFGEQDKDVDLLIIESTYGNRTHDPVVDRGPCRYISMLTNSAWNTAVAGTRQPALARFPMRTPSEFLVSW